MDLSVRTIADDEVADWCRGVGRGFLYHPTKLDEELEWRRAGIDLQRTYAGFDGDQIVSTLRSFATRLTVPGGSEVAAGAVTAVTTTQSHRRRGLATRMVHADLRDSADRGEAASVLIAAEWGIYGRFGYGATTEHQTLTLHTNGTRLRAEPQGSAGFVDRDTARSLVPGIYDVQRSNTPGELTWDDRDWDRDFGIVALEHNDDKPSFHVIARSTNGDPIGYLRYRYEEKWERRQAAGRANVGVLIASSIEGQALLWKHLIELDLSTSAVIQDRPPDDRLPWLLTDPRQVAPSERADFLWLRVLDASSLLAARRYAVPGRLVIELVDDLGIANGRFLLDATEDDVTCVSTELSADLTMPVSSLASLYLGGHRAHLLADVGLIDEHTSGAVARADLMFGAARSPWSSTWF